MFTVGPGESLRPGKPFTGCTGTAAVAAAAASGSTMHSSLPVVLMVIVGMLSDQMELWESCLIARRRWEALRLGKVIGPGKSNSSRSSMVARVGVEATEITTGGVGGFMVGRAAAEDVLLPNCSGALGVGESGSGVGGISRRVALELLDGGGGGV